MGRNEQDKSGHLSIFTSLKHLMVLLRCNFSQGFICTPYQRHWHHVRTCSSDYFKWKHCYTMPLRITFNFLTYILIVYFYAMKPIISHLTWYQLTANLNLKFLTNLNPPLSWCLPPRGYLVAYPLAFRPGVAERLSVTIFNSDDPILVEARIRWRNETLAEVDEMITGRSMIIVF